MTPCTTIHYTVTMVTHSNMQMLKQQARQQIMQQPPSKTPSSIHLFGIYFGIYIFRLTMKPRVFQKVNLITELFQRKPTQSHYFLLTVICCIFFNGFLVICCNLFMDCCNLLMFFWCIWRIWLLSFGLINFHNFIFLLVLC